MTPERWKQIDELAQSALERGSDERAAFLAAACAGDDALRGEVESQIVYQQQASRFLEEPAFKHAAELIAETQTETESMEGRSISHYTILRKLGAGGMGEIYLAEDTTLGRKVAIKFVSQNSVAGEQAGKRFVREARAAAALDHPHICAVYEVGEEAGYSFIVMQYVGGETLASRIQRQPLDLGESLDIATQIADALAEAHSHRIIHRDVKPENVMLTASGEVKVLDFGLARLVHEGSLIDSLSATESRLSVPGLIIGTVPYMSPEQVRGEALDARSDIFSFGSVLYEMLSGRHPFQAESVGATMSSILTNDPAPLVRYASEAPDELQRIVRKALTKNKEGRYQGIKDLLIDLRELKQELEFEAKLERSIDPEVRDRSTTPPEQAERAGLADPKTAPQRTVHAGESFTTRTTSGTSVVVGEIKRHKLGVSLTLVALVIVAAAAFFYLNRKPALTDKDTILLADFDTTTGDAEFDGAIKQALAIHLGQSPFLNIFTNERVQETLRFMNRSPDERLTRDVAREICERVGLKAMLVGSIARLGSHYVIALDAVNAHTSDVLAREQVEAESKEQVLSMLGKAATRLREKLGESLITIQKFDVPIDQATTSSLEALKAYSAGTALARKRKFPEANIFLKRAVELDSNFVGAYAALANNSFNLGEKESGKQYATKAFQMRGHLGERERLGIESAYYLYATRELEKAIEALELLKQTYPRDGSAGGGLGFINFELGNHERALEEAVEHLRQNPTSLNNHLNVAYALMCLGRYDEAREVVQRAQSKNLGPASGFHQVLYHIAFNQGDSAAMQTELEHFRASRDPDSYWFFWLSAMTAEANGQLRNDREMTDQVAESFKQSNQRERAADLTAGTAGTDALFGHCELARKDAARALSIARSPESLLRTALAFALCGDVGQAQSLADEAARLLPTDTLANTIRLPVIRAAIAIHSGNHARAIELLQAARRYDRADGFSAHYLRGIAYLGQRSAVQAGAEFQFILDHRSIASYSPFYPLARLGLARAYVVSGDNEKARKAYEDFFVLWKDADADLPVLIEAKKEYGRLK